MRTSTPRREFLGTAALGAAGLSCGGCFPDVGGEWAVARAGCEPPAPLEPVAGAAVVAEAYEPTSVIERLGRYELDAAVVAAMVEAVLAVLAGGVQPAWPALLPDYAPGMRIGIKVNCLNEGCATSVPVVRALVASLQRELGVAAGEVVVWDRRQDELVRAGFTAEAVGAQVLGTLDGGVAGGGPGYETDYCTAAGRTTRLSRILTELTDLTINCPVLKTHGITGVTGAMKNVYGVVDNPEVFHDRVDEAMPALYALEPIRARLRLHVIDALIAVTAGGTSSPPDSVPRRVFASRDPLAADVYALDLVNALRASEKGMPAVDPGFTGWIAAAHARGLGARAYELWTARP